MKTVWILENIKPEEKFFLHEIELICLIASVSNWKKIFPHSNTILYCCDSVFRYLDNLGIIDLWNEINREELNKKDRVNRKAFWAASKLKCMKNIEAPFIMLDCDLFFKNRCFEFSDLEEYDIVVNQIEEGARVYPSINDEILSGLVGRYPTKYQWKTSHSPNVSFLYIKDDEFRKEYVKTAWTWMEYISDNFSNHPKLNGKYMIFCEQKLLKEISDLRDKKMSALLGEFLFNEENIRMDLSDEYGTLDLKEGPDYVHLHAKKRFVRSDENLFLSIKSDLLKSIIDLESFSPKLLHQILIKNKEIFST